MFGPVKGQRHHQRRGPGEAERLAREALEQGDVFVFNRRLCHRGGENTTGVRRNSCIMQCVWLFGLGQHKIDSERVLANLRASGCASFAALTPAQLKDFTLRLQKPYPIDTTISN